MGERAGTPQLWRPLALAAVIEAALAALQVQLEGAVKAAKSTSATGNPTSQQSSEIHRMARQAEDASSVAERWARHVVNQQAPVPYNRSQKETYR